MTDQRPVRRLGLIVLSILGLGLWISGAVDHRNLRGTLQTLLGVNPIDEFTAGIAPAESAIHVELEEMAKSQYGGGDRESSQRSYGHYAQRAGYTIDSGLSQAAREVARFYAQTRRLAPSGVLAFILDSAGAAFWGVRQTVVVTTNQRTSAVNAILDPPNADGDRWVVGIGEVFVDGSPPLRIMVGLSARETIRLAPTPRRYSAGDSIALRGTLTANHSDLFAIAMGPTGEFQSVPIDTKGKRFSGLLKATRGDWTVELIGTGPSGPIPLAQLTFHVDSPMPTSYSDVWPPVEARLSNTTEYMLGLINRDRRLASLPPLRRVPSLDKIALNHSRDMSEHRFVGHVSPSTGTVGDRLNRGGVARLAHGENVALNSTITDAHHGLMRSLGHRRNLLSSRFSEVGIGLISTRQGWYVTQVFSQPVESTAALGGSTAKGYKDSKLSRYGALAN